MKTWMIAGSMFLSLGCQSPTKPEDGTREIFTPSQESSWISLSSDRYEGWETSEYGGGEVIRAEESLALDAGYPITGAHWAGDFPRTNYELALDATKVFGGDFFLGLTFPVDESHCTLILGGWGGALCGLSTLDGIDASGNETKQFLSFEVGKSYGVRVKVRSDAIKVWVDESLIIDQGITGMVVGIRPEMEPSKPLGIATFNTKATYNDIRYRPTKEVVAEK